mgnify:CR=1 FL=1|tara:strand:+ start:239 stop:388 length:150 start_codon:yes stop_codon:yes gene_type:complete
MSYGLAYDFPSLVKIIEVANAVVYQTVENLGVGHHAFILVGNAPFLEVP